MTPLYSARHSFTLLRPKNKVKLPTQSAEKWICIGKWAFKIGAELFLKNKKVLGGQIFQGLRMLPMSPLKHFIKKSLHSSADVGPLMTNNGALES